MPMSAPQGMWHHPHAMQHGYPPAGPPGGGRGYLPPPPSAGWQQPPGMHAPGPYGMPGGMPPHQQPHRMPPPQPHYQRPGPPVPRIPADPSTMLKAKYDQIIQAPPPFPAQAVQPPLEPSHEEAVRLAQGRSHWGIAQVPDPTEKRGETQEWQQLQPGDARVYQGYADLPASQDPQSAAKARALMDVYERVMSRPPAGTFGADPRAETPCKFWASGRFCKFGDQCAWSHAGTKGSGGFFFQRSDPRSKVACTFHMQGRCLRGADCPFSHKPAPAPAPAPAASAAQQPPQKPNAPPEGSGYKGFLPPN